MNDSSNNQRNIYRELTEIRSVMAEQNAAIRSAIAEQTATLKAVDAKIEDTRASVRRIWESQNEQDKELASLKTKASVIGAAAGAAVAGGVALMKWLLGGKQ